MNIRPVENQSKLNTIANIATNSMVAGVVVSEIQKLRMPVETRAAIKNARLGLDKFVLASEKAAKKTAKNLNTTFDMKQIASNAKKIFPEMVKTANNANKKLNKTCMRVMIATAAISTAFALTQKSKQTKEQ